MWQDDVGGWFYCHPNARAPFPPSGCWTTDGYTGRDADPPPLVSSEYADSRSVLGNKHLAADIARFWTLLICNIYLRGTCWVEGLDVGELGFWVPPSLC